MEVGAIQSRRLRGKNEIHSGGERDPGARWWHRGEGVKEESRERGVAKGNGTKREGWVEVVERRGDDAKGGGGSGRQ